MADQFITINDRNLQRYGRTSLKKLRGQMAAARRHMLNNMAFAVRSICIDWGIPHVMTVRNRNLLRVSLRVSKATRAKEVATMGQTKRGPRFDALVQQEKGGGVFKTRQPAFKGARGDSARGKMKPKSKFRGDILSPDDIQVKNEKNWEHRIHVFLEMIQRENYNKAFIMHGSNTFKSGLMIVGKKTGMYAMKQKFGYSKKSKKTGRTSTALHKRYEPTRHLITTRSFEKNQKRVRKLRWMRPSIDKYLRQSDARMEWRRAMRHAMRGQKK